MYRSILLLLLLLICQPGRSQSPHTRVPFGVEELQRRTFQYFWELADSNAQTPDRWPTLTFSSIAATGFGLSGYIVGVEHGWVTREQAADRVLKTLRVLAGLPQGPAEQGMSGYRGFFYHFLDHQKARRYKDVELSTIDSGLLLAGVLSCQSYFDQENATEKAIRETADLLYRRVEWDWMLNAEKRLSMGWRPERGFIHSEWHGYNEAMILYILALGSPTHPIPATSWNAWCQNYYLDSFYGQEHVNFGPLFGHQYSHIWIDFRGIQDAYMRDKGLDYFENSRRATLSNRAYCLENPGGFKGYGPNAWGLTACDGPADWLTKFRLQIRCPEPPERFRGYNARGAASDYRQDDGTLAPTAAGGSVPFAPEVCLPALEHMWNTWYDSLIGQYGFKDAFNPSFTACGELPEGWFDVDYLGIDQGPILLMLENYRSGLIWEIMKKNPYIRRGLQRAGFAGGWLTGAPPPVEEIMEIWTNPDIPVDPEYFFERQVYRKSASEALPYRLLRPAVRPVDSLGRPQRLPLVIFLHGSGERGIDNLQQLRNGVLAFAEPNNRSQYPCYVLAPQCPPGLRWSGVDLQTAATWRDQPTLPMQLLIELIEYTIKNNPAIDPDRIYLTGLSMGGAGTFDLLMRKPEWFAAALPLCGGGDPAQAARIKDIPLWVLHGSQDETVPAARSRKIVAALKALGAPVQYTEFLTLRHAIWNETYYNPEVLLWLFAQRK